MTSQLGTGKSLTFFYSAYATKLSNVQLYISLKDTDLTMLVTFGVILAKTGMVVTPFTQEQMSRTFEQYYNKSLHFVHENYFWIMEQAKVVESIIIHTNYVQANTEARSILQQLGSNT